MPPPPHRTGSDGDPRRWGVFLGTVTRVDAERPRRGRVEVRVDDIAAEPLGWAEPRGASTGPQTGHRVVPPVGAQVYVTFLNGDFARPLWEPGPWREDDVPDEVSDDTDPESERRLFASTDRGLRIIEERDGRVEVSITDRSVHIVTGDANLLLNTSESDGKNVARAGDDTDGHDHTVYLGVAPAGAPGSYVIVASPTAAPGLTPVTIPRATDTIAAVSGRKVLV